MSLKTYIHSDPSCGYPCDLCGEILTTKYRPQVCEGWLWFCGYGDRPAHFCPTCVRTKRHELETIRAMLNQKPVNYNKDNMLSTDNIVKTVLLHRV